MARILAIDFGTKRTGLAWTDELQLSINPLEAVTPDEAVLFIQQNQDQIETLVLGMPSEATHSTEAILNFRNRLKNAFPDLAIEMVDESDTSREAREYMIRLGYKKSDRERKENIDKIAAAIILQRYLDAV